LTSPVREVTAAALVLLIAGALSLSHWYHRLSWTPDGLFYAAQTLEVRGASEKQSLERVFHGQPARALRHDEGLRQPLVGREIDDPQWVRYSANFYRRRWLVPVLAAALYPWMGLRAVEVVSLLGYVLAGLFIYLLLRRRFSARVAALGSTICLVLPAFRTWSFLPLTDSWGVALEAASLTAAIAVVRSGLVFLPLWVISIGALSVTRDVALAIVVAVGYLAVCRRTRRYWLLFASGLAAALPAPMFLGAPLKDQLNWAFSGYHVVRHPTWHAVLHDYVPSLHSFVVLDLRTELPTVLLFVTAFVALWMSRHSHDEYLQLVRTSAVATTAYLAMVPVYTGFRLELALLPMAAGGFALVIGRSPWPFARTAEAPPSKAGFSWKDLAPTRRR
jgi:hypothetical protein